MNILQRFWVVYPSGYLQFEVRSGTNAFGVDLNTRQCECRSWQMRGIPCLHGMAAISSLNHDAETYVAPCFSKESFIKCYTYNVHPLNGSSMWPKTCYIKPFPPKKRRLPGRPTVNRKKDQSEKKTTRHTVSKKGGKQKCSICMVPGHNKSKCPTKGSGSGSGSRNVPGDGDVPIQVQVPVDVQVQVPVDVQVPDGDGDVDVQVPDGNGDVDVQVPDGDGDVPVDVPVQVPEGDGDVDVPVQVPMDVQVPDGDGDVPVDVPVQVQVDVPVDVPVQVQVQVPVGGQADGIANHVRKRKPSERITKLGLCRRVVPKDGSGCIKEKPVNLD